MERYTFNTYIKECEDCKYYMDNECIHPYSQHCNNCELWTPYWYEENELKRNVLSKNSEDTGVNVFNMTNNNCKWCKDFTEIKGTFWAINPYKKLNAGNTIKFKYCPMCGRKI